MPTECCGCHPNFSDITEKSPTISVTSVSFGCYMINIHSINLERFHSESNFLFQTLFYPESLCSCFRFM